MTTRSQWHEIELPAKPEAVFNLLLSPKIIRGRWDQVGAIITEMDGLWVFVWGERESDPDCITGARIRSFTAPTRVLLAYEYCRTRTGMMPFGATMTAEFTIQRITAGSVLRVTQSGFPPPGQHDAFYDSCGQGWRAALQGIGTILSPPPPRK
ncbi:MAG: SRPBCC domain-containing protein [Alphaproteobacteria bacterium]|nr:SRPBCC domain-containing protein [Alphaproteobacteria bacterium]